MKWRFWEKEYLVNPVNTPTDTILTQMNEMRPLPLGMTEFKAWSDRIISGACIPCDNKDSLVATLAVMLQSLGPQESHKPDAYFIHSLRKAATNEVARHVFTDLKKKRDEQTQKENDEKTPKLVTNGNSI